MATHNSLDQSGRALTQGQSAEDLFKAIAIKSGFKVRSASSHEERIGHFDFVITKENPLRVEVKSKKGFSILNNSRRTDDFVLIEWKTVTGHDGWIYGQADLIALEREDGFYIVPRKTLLILGQELCSEEFVDSREKMLYKTYGRKDRQDSVSAILLSDLIATKNFSFWKK